MQGVTPQEEARLLGPVLKGTSRAFYLTLRVLPGNLRKPLGLAYLLARTADTIADSKTASTHDRLARLLEFRGLVEGRGKAGNIEPLVRTPRRGWVGPRGSWSRPCLRPFPCSMAWARWTGSGSGRSWSR